MQTNDNLMFCPNCGTALQSSVQKTTILQQQENSFNHKFPKETQYKSTVTLKTQNIKKKKFLKTILMLMPVIVVLAVLIGACSFVFSKLNSPLVKIGSGMKNLIISNEAYTYKILYDDGYDEYKISGNVKFDLKGKNIDATNIKVNADGESANIEAFLHTNEKEIGFSASDNNGTESLTFYNGYIFKYDDGELWDSYYISEFIEDFITDDPEKFNDGCFEIISLLFDVANSDRKIEDTQKQVIDILNDIIDNENFNLDADETVKINSEIEKQVTEELKKYLTDNDWLEENLGLSVSKNGKETVYTFDIDIEKVVDALYDILKPLLKDTYEQVLVLAGDKVEYMDSYNDIVDDFMDEIDYYAEEISSFVITVAMTKNQINSFNAVIMEKYEGEIYTTEVKIEISKADSFKSPNISNYKKEIDKAGEISVYDNNRTCSNNIRDIKQSAIASKYFYEENISSVSDIESMFENGQLPECPLSDNGNHYDDYVIAIDSNGYAKVYCKNYGNLGHYPDSSETQSPERPIS